MSREVGKARICGLIGCIALVFVLGGAGLLYKGTIGKANKDLDRVIHKSTLAYTEGTARDLARKRLEYNREEDDVAKKAILNYIVSEYSNLDTSKIVNEDLRKWVEKAINGTLK